MAGLPCSGKSRFTNLLAEFSSDLMPVQPESLYPENMHELSVQEKNTICINSWQIGLDVLRDCIKTNEPAIIFDTCGSHYTVMEEIIDEYKNSEVNNKVIVIYVNATLDECKRRSIKENRQLSDSVWKLYTKRLVKTLPMLKNKANVFVVLSNHDGENKTETLAKKMAGIINGKN